MSKLPKQVYMKSILSLLLVSLMIFSGFNCSKKNASVAPNEQILIKAKEVVTKANVSCNTVNPELSLQWLKEIIIKAEEDKQTKKHRGNYMGKIYATSYRSQPVFSVQMALGSGGIYAYVYDCGGKTVYIEQSDTSKFAQDTQNGTLIYANAP